MKRTLHILLATLTVVAILAIDRDARASIVEDGLQLRGDSFGAVFELGMGSPGFGEEDSDSPEPADPPDSDDGIQATENGSSFGNDTRATSSAGNSAILADIFSTYKLPTRKLYVPLDHVASSHLIFQLQRPPQG